MENILFIFKYPVCLSENLKFKFDGETDACIKLGYQVWHIEWDGTAFYLTCKNTGEKILLLKGSGRNQERYYHTRYFVDLYRSVSQAIKRISFSYLYMRYMPYFPPLAKTMKRACAAGARLIIEIPTYPVENEMQKEKRWLRRMIFNLIQRYQQRVIAKAELLTICGAPVDGQAYGIRAININNGINTDALPLRRPTDVQDEVHVLLLASMCYWHGYDRVIEGLKNYTGKTKVILHFVGEDGDGSLENWKGLVRDNHMEKNVWFHGALYGEKLQAMFDQSDVGVATLGLHRKGMQVDSSLKTREYMSRGLPFLCTDYVTALDDTLPFVMRVNSDETPININELATFALKNKMQENTPNIMRNYAEKNMSWVTEFKKIMAAVNKE